MLARADRRTMFWISAPVAIGASLMLWAGPTRGEPLLPEYATSLVVAVALLVALLLWVVLRGNASFAIERIAASIALAPAGYGVVDALARTVDARAFTILAPVISTVLVAAGALAVTLLRPSGTARWARELGLAIVAVPATIAALVLPTEQTWLVLLLAGVTVLLVAVSPDGLVGSASARKHLGWLALALATAGLWWRLTSDSVDAIEPYVLPLAGMLLLIALLVWHSARRDTANPVSSAAPWITLGALLVAVLPIAIAAATGALERAIIIGIVSAVLLGFASFARLGDRVQPYLDAAATAGALGVLVVAAGRSWFLVAAGAADLRLDAWLGAALVVLFAAAFGQAGRSHASRLPEIVAQLLAGSAILLALFFQFGALDDSQLAQLRMLIWVALFALVAMVSLTVDRGPLRPAVGWVAIAAVAGLALCSAPAATLTALELAALLVIIALVSSAVALVVTVLDRSTVPRVVRESGLALLGLIGVLLTLTSEADAAWLVLEVAAVAALLVAVAPDGIFGAASARKHIGWLALALAVGGLWWRLSGTEVRDVEPYVLPLAGALLLIALLVWRARSPHSTGAGAAPLITLGALLVAILPIALNGAAGSVVRPIAVGAISAALLLGGSLLPGSARLRPYLDVAATAGAIGVLVVAIGRSWFITAETGTPDAALDAWLAASLVVLLVAGFGQARMRVDANPAIRSAIGQALGLTALAVVLFFELTVFNDTTIGAIRALGTVLLLCVVHAASIAVDRSPLTRLVAWVAFAFAAIAAGAGLVSGAFDEIEFATVPLALALASGGLLHLSRVASARSWPHLGPALLVLLVPSLLAAIDDRPIWRVAAIAVVGIGLIVGGLAARLQAPFIIGALVTIVHTVTTFSPQLRELYEVNSWLVWIVIGTIGGTLLIVMAARFEKSLNSARSTLRRVSELR